MLYFTFCLCQHNIPKQEILGLTTRFDSSTGRRQALPPHLCPLRPLRADVCRRRRNVPARYPQMLCSQSCLCHLPHKALDRHTSVGLMSHTCIICWFIRPEARYLLTHKWQVAVTEIFWQRKDLIAAFSTSSSSQMFHLWNFSIFKHLLPFVSFTDLNSHDFVSTLSLRVQ